MEKDLTLNQIVKNIDSLKMAVKQRCNKNIRYTLSVLCPTLSSEYITRRTADKDSTEDGKPLYDDFLTALNILLDDPTVVKIRCHVENTNGKGKDKDFEGEIDTHPQSIPIQYAYPVQTITKNTNENENNKAQSQSTMNVAINQVLGLMGFSCQGQTEYQDDTIAGLGAVLNIRDQQIENRHIQADKDRRHEEVLAEKVKLESRVESLNKELEDERKYSEELEDKIEDLNGQIEELNKLKPESSFLGTSLVAALTKAGTNLAIKHADVIGGLAGVSREEMVDMLKSAEMPQQTAQAQSDVDVDVETVGKHSEQISAIDKFLNQLSDENFDAVWALMTAFSKDQTLISKALQSISNE